MIPSKLMHLHSMHLINVEAFLEREQVMSDGEGVNYQAEVLDSTYYDEATSYAILSHRWTEQEVNYEEIVDLAKMEKKEQIRQRLGYRKILASCVQAKKDKFEWLWVDTCCIDKRSSAELSEAINSMYRWYKNAGVCYAYFHDVPDPLFPTAPDRKRYRKFNGWPEWFSRGWTLQELIAPSDVQFFNKNWQNIGDKRALAPTLADITKIPEHILTHGLCGNRPCIAQIMSWAANRTTTRVEDRAYSLMGLLEVNMPMLYGEGKKAFHRLQLEIIRASNDQSIFAWSRMDDNKQTGNILANDPRFFEDCGTMVLMGHDEFIQYIKKDIAKEGLNSIEDRLGTFPIMNRGIQIWLPLRPSRESRSHFVARLPCRRGPSEPPETIDLVLLESNYYRDPGPAFWALRSSTDTTSAGPTSPSSPPPPVWQLCQVYLRYQDPPRCNTTFKIDDSALIENGFTCCGAYPKKFAGDTLTLTSINSLGIRVYSDNQTNARLVVSLGQSLGKDWIYVVSDDSNINLRTSKSWEIYMNDKYWEMKSRMPTHARHVNKARSGVEQVCIMQTRLPRSTRILQISSIMWKRLRICGVKLGVFHNPGSSDVSGEWTAFDVDVGCFSLHISLALISLFI